MRPLVATQLMLTWLSMCSADESTTSRQRNSYIAHTSTILIFNVICLFANLAYCFEFITTDFDGATLAFMVVIAEFGAIYFMITTIPLRHQIDSIFTSLSTIYKSRKFLSIYVEHL